MIDLMRGASRTARMLSPGIESNKFRKEAVIQVNEARAKALAKSVMSNLYCESLAIAPPANVSAALAP